MPTEFVVVGRVLRPHGVRGDLLLEPLSDVLERLAEVETVYLGEAEEPHPVRGVRRHRGRWLLRLADCADRNAAEAFRGMLVRMRRERAAPPPGSYFHHQIIGLAAVTAEGERLGEVVEIIETGANDVYVVRGPQGEILLPALRSVIREIDLEAGRMTVHLMEGLR
jgi:16S rRNA processing protein RimM